MDNNYDYTMIENMCFCSSFSNSRRRNNEAIASEGRKDRDRGCCPVGG